MIQLTTRVPIPDITKIKLRRLTIDDDANEISVLCDSIGQGGFVYKTHTMVVRDGVCTGVRVTIAPVAYDDRVQAFTLDVSNAFTLARAVIRTGGAPSVLYPALETALQASGLLPAGVVS